ncbi:MAG: hypothetical protein AAB897_01020 [Patescibacteria group bacterium]
MTDAERLERLTEIASFANREPLTDAEFAFLENNFEWNAQLLRRVRFTRARPFEAFLDGFTERCLTCRVERNYCCD